MAHTQAMPVTNRGKQIGEYHLNKLHGKAKCSYPSGDSYYWEYKDGKEHGEGILKESD